MNWIVRLWNDGQSINVKELYTLNLDWLRSPRITDIRNDEGEKSVGRQRGVDESKFGSD